MLGEKVVQWRNFKYTYSQVVSALPYPEIKYSAFYILFFNVFPNMDYKKPSTAAVSDSHEENNNGKSAGESDWSDRLLALLTIEPRARRLGVRLHPGDLGQRVLLLRLSGSSPVGVCISPSARRLPPPLAI